LKAPFKRQNPHQNPTKSHLGRRAGGDLEDRCSHESPGTGDGFVIRSADLRRNLMLSITMDPWWFHREQHAVSPGNLGNMVVSTMKNMLFFREN